MMHAWTADIVVCDIRMPRYSGVWLIEHLRTLYPSTAIIISTGYGEIDPALMLRAKITGYLAKPYDRETLIASLERRWKAGERANRPFTRSQSKSQSKSKSQVGSDLRTWSLGSGIWDFLLLLYPIALLLKHREQSLRADEVRGADDDEAGRGALQAVVELRHPVAVALGDERVVGGRIAA